MIHSRACSLLISLLLLAGSQWCPAQTTNTGWRLLFADNFNQPSLGPNWRWMYACGRRAVSDHAIRASHGTVVICTVPLPDGETRVEFDLLLPPLPPLPASNNSTVRSVNFELRGGEWGGGGANDRFETVFVTGATAANPALDPAGRIPLVPDQPHHVVLQISGATGTATVDGQRRFAQPVPPPRSEVNRYFVFKTNGMNAAPGKDVALSNFKIWAGPTAVLKLPLRPNSAAENRRATAHAADFIDPANPGPGMQQAIDSLPPTGGLVVLPAGEFVLRRHLRLRNGVTLGGQGAGRTILKAESGERGPIRELTRGPGHCVVTLAPADAARFRVGDGVCFDDNWGHPGFLDVINKDCVVTAVTSNQVTVSGVAPADAKSLLHWFPLIYAQAAEFVEIKDLTLVGGEGGYGGFQSSAITFGQVAGARVARVQIAKWLGDGFSLQTGADAIVTDNTVANANAGYHPGTTTQRFLFTRNLGLGNRACGLYFCWLNRSGVYYRNVVDWFDGYAWPGDSFDVIADNVCTSTNGFHLEQGEGGGGVIFHNQFAKIQVGHPAPGITYDFLLADNQADSFTFLPRDIRYNMFVGNHNQAGEPLAPAGPMPSGNFFSGPGAGLDLHRFPLGIERRTPAAPPVLPPPLLDGRKFYNPANPAAGFQKALNQLAKTGGTLLLPAGRYGLAQPLVVPSGVTLAGCGLGTVLHAARPGQTNSLVIVRHAASAAVRDLVILGEYERRAFRAAAIVLQDVNNGELAAVDVRGWEGTAVKVSGGGVQVRDCRALGCAGNGFEFTQCRVTGTGNIARDCTDGFVLNRPGPGARLEANIAANNFGTGYVADQANGLLLAANNASFNVGDGFRLAHTDQAELVANMIAMNHLAGTAGCGIRLAATTRNCRVYYNNCQDETGTPQTIAIAEDAAAGPNIIRFNLAGRPAHLHTEGQGSTVSDNFTE